MERIEYEESAAYEKEFDPPSSPLLEVAQQFADGSGERVGAQFDVESWLDGYETDDAGDVEQGFVEEEPFSSYAELNAAYMAASPEEQADYVASLSDADKQALGRMAVEEQVAAAVAPMYEQHQRYEESQQQRAAWQVEQQGEESAFVREGALAQIAEIAKEMRSDASPEEIHAVAQENWDARERQYIASGWTREQRFEAMMAEASGEERAREAAGQIDAYYAVRRGMKPPGGWR